ncbi:MAG: hypothetical protein O3A36_01675 [bacterium]|nr:hypothetical protein [bacterium]
MANKAAYEIHCTDAAQFFSCIAVWEALHFLKAKHYAGPTVEGIVDHTNIQMGVVQRALATLGGNNPEKGCLQMKYCQEGTAGPIAARFSQRSDVVPEFVVQIRADNNYKMRIT